ncbi:hypothetical protein L6Q21_11600 [Sandaracinobacter sp. RS1-74]|uniref:DUF6925 family protein n=1 Tax=Sandaracinobacteroides sayramensis TaxID=2913411 RepID=UPI001EDB765C|nr:hypothetical protein [Sandaracinobacteroides sayramensis]MCG2841625.1 hypothetical protein [Sandaracinobacteroides sayramensis]
MQPAEFALIADLIEDPLNGWSIGSFGVVGEFLRDADEPAKLDRGTDFIEVVTARGGMRAVDAGLSGVAWDSLSADGESWGHALAFCRPMPAEGPSVVRDLGVDSDALRPEERGLRLFDLGLGCGHVSMAVRTQDAALIAALEAAEGLPTLSIPGIMPLFVETQPQRILLSPAGRIEIFQPIPPPDGKSPEGPHTHLLPKLAAKNRPHSANTPIPEGWQSLLSMHPKSPWRTMLGERHPFEPETDAAFAPLLDRFGLADDKDVERRLRAALDADALPWPDSRRGRHKARILLRRLHAAGDPRAAQWRALHDRAPIEIEEGEEA